MKTGHCMLVATTGGHLSQLHELEKRMTGNPAKNIWVTFDTPQSRSMLAGRKVEFVAPIGERDAIGAIWAAKTAYALIQKHGPSAVVSTGSAVAVPFLNVATLCKVPAHYIESAARVLEPSLTGKLLQLNPWINLYRQYDISRSARWKFAGSIFDAFEVSAQASATGHSIRRIVVTLGTGPHPFGRLVDNLLAIIPQGVDVFWQTGCTPVHNNGHTSAAEIPFAELQQQIATADVVIGHAGCGTALAALNAGRLPLLSPRTVAKHELVDDHQVQIAEWLSKRGLAILREAGQITWKDIVAASAFRVGKLRNPPSLRLAG